MNSKSIIIKMSNHQTNHSLNSSKDYSSSSSYCSLCRFPLIKVISDSLLSLIEESKRLSSYNTATANTYRTSSPFYFPKLPPITIHKYLIRIVENARLSESTVIIALIYLDCLFKEHQDQILIDEYTIHRLIIASIIIAVKYNEDVIYKEAYYAKVAGLSKKELAGLELQMLKMMEYKLYVESTLYETYKNYFEGLLVPQMKEIGFSLSKQLMLCL